MDILIEFTKDPGNKSTTQWELHSLALRDFWRRQIALHSVSVYKKWYKRNIIEIWAILRKKGGGGKVIHTKYSKHCPSTVAHTFECVCSKINHGFNHGLFISLLKHILSAPYIELYMCNNLFKFHIWILKQFWHCPKWPVLPRHIKV